MKPSSPCVNLLLSLLAPLVCFTAATATDYVVDGVDTQDITKSTRFYDSGKGVYWELEGQPYRGAEQLYKKHGDFSFLGELADRIYGTKFTKGAFTNLIDDGSACWFCVGANVIQYWESYYGVFYKGDETLLYGYTYDSANLTTLAGTQSLDIHMAFYDSWETLDKSVGGDGEMAIEWYLASGKNVNEGKANYCQLKKDAPCPGAFYSEYFQGSASSREAYYVGSDASDLRSATDFLKEAFGFDDNGNQVTYGQIAYVGVLTPISTGQNLQGHALTCYGFTVGEDGLLESIYLTNSDDMSYGITQVYVGLTDDGYLHLYQDAAHNKEWMYAGVTWNICDITYINTPTVLREMYDEYNRAALTWTGARSTWSDKDAAAATTEKLPDGNTGWQVYALDGYYNSYYHTGRAVEFSDQAANTSVSLQGALSTPELQLDNNAKAYTFTGSTGATLTADAITKRGAADAVFSKVAITAGTVDVSMGSLSLGQGSTLSARTGRVGNFGTLQLNGGNATFTDGLTVCDSATLAVNKAATLTTTLNLEAGASLLFNTGNSAALTLTGNLNVLGDCYLSVTGGALASGQSYTLMNVTGSITGWEDIATNYGSITLIGKQLVLNYTAPGALTWRGGSGTWSSSQWDGGTAESTGKDLTFSPSSGPAEITVTGNVSPNSMHFAQGEFHLVAGQGASVSGCHTITLGNGATIYANVPLSGGNISMESGSTLYMTLTTAQSEITGLEMAPGSTVVFRGSSRYVVDKVGALGGHIQLQDTTSLVLGSSLDTELYGTFSGDAGAAIVLMNSSGSHPVTFYLGQDSGRFMGSVTIGTDDDAPLTTLRMDSATRNFTITGNGELSLRGKGDITGKVKGTGTLTIEHNATYQLAQNRAASFSKTVALNVEGTAYIGTQDAALRASASLGAITVSGELTTYYNSTDPEKSLNLDSLTLQGGGTYTIAHMEQVDTSSHFIQKLVVDGSGTLCNSITDNTKGSLREHTIEIQTLSGTGTLTVKGGTQCQTTKTVIDGTAAGGFNGDLVIRNPHASSYFEIESTHELIDNGAVVEMVSGSLNGTVLLDAQGITVDMSAAGSGEGLAYVGLAGFGVGGDISVHGVDDALSSKATWLYSGTFNGATTIVDSATEGFLSYVTPEHHTLTLNGAGEYDFHGKVTAWLNLSKTGSGTQTFSGDTSAFEGALSVSGGELAFENAIYKATSVTLGGGTLRLHGGTLTNLSGDGGTLALEAGAYSIDLTGASGNHAVQLNGTTANVSGSGSLGGSITATGTSGITVDNGGQLVLQSAITNSGTITLKGSFNASALTLNHDSETHVDTNGNTGSSGFSKIGGYSVTIVNGGTTINNGATITHNGLPSGTLTLGTDGKATQGGSVDYTSYLLANGGSASVSAINNKAGNQLKTIDVQGGTLTVDAATDKIAATSGTVSITKDVVVGGTARNTSITATAGTLNTALSGTTSITKTGTGTLTVTHANSQSGMTSIKGGTLTVADKAALGTGQVQLSGGTLDIAVNGFGNTITSAGTSSIIVESGKTLALQNTISNIGTLTLQGSIDASALTLTRDAETHVDTKGNTGKSGFTKSGSSSVTIVNGGTTVNSGATITHSGLPSGTLTLGTDGKATTGGTVDYSSYLLTTGDSASVSDINAKAGAKLKSIEVTGGTLNVDTSTNLLKTTGGTLEVGKSVTLGGTIGGTTKLHVGGAGVKATINQATTYSGETFVGNDAVLHVGENGTLGSSSIILSCGTLELECDKLSNSITTSCSGGTISVLKGHTLKLTAGALSADASAPLTLKGSFDASNLKLEQGQDTHVDLNGVSGASGFSIAGGYSVTIVNGATINDGATITHKGLPSGTLTLGKDGKATQGGTVDYSSYLLTGRDSAGLAAIVKAAGKKLTSIDLQGGTLNIVSTKGESLGKGITLNMDGGTVAGNLIVATGSTLRYSGGSFTVAPELKGGTLDMGTTSSISITGSKASITLGGLDVRVTSKGIILTGDDLDVKGGTVTLTALSGYKGDLVAEGGSTLKISTGKQTVDNDIIVKGSAVLNNGSTHSGDITVNGDLLKNSTIKLISSSQRVSLNGGAMSGTISGIGRVDVNGSVDLTLGKLTAEQVYLNGTLTHTKGWTLTKGQTLTLGGGKVAGNLIVATGSTLDFNGYTLAAAPELKGGTLDMGAATSITVTGTKASITLGKQDVYVTAKGTILTGDDLDVKGGTVTLTALNGYKGDLVAEGGSTLKISTGKQTVDNDIIVKGSAVLNNGSTHSGDITVNGDLLKNSTIKLIDKGQRVTLSGGAMNGTISGIGRVDVNGSVDLTLGKLTAEQVYLNGTLTHTKGWTLTKGQTLTLGGGKVAGNLIVATGSTLDFNGYTLAAAPELKGGTLDMGATSSISITGTKASITLGKQDVNVTAKGIILTGDDLDVKGGTITLNALNGYKGDLVAEGGSTLKISTGKQTVDNDIIVKGSAVLNNGSTHSGDITVNGDLLKNSTIKLISSSQRVSLNGGAMSGTISGIGRVDVNGSVDLTLGKLTAEQVYLNGTLTHTKGWTLTKGQTLTLGGGKVAGNLIVATGSTLDFNGYTLAAAPELKGGTLDMGATSSITVTGTKASITLGKQDVYVTAKGIILTGDDLDVKGGTVTLTALDGYKGDLIAEGGSTLKISTGKQTVDNDIVVKGSAELNNGSTHSGDITVNGDLLKNSTIKLIDKGQRVTLSGGAMNGTISGIGRVDVNGSVDITLGKLTAEQVYLNGTLTHTKGWTLTKGQTLTLGGGKVAGNLIVATGSTLDFNGYTLTAAPELKGGTLNMGAKSSLTITGSKANVSIGKQDVYVTSKGTILSDSDLDVKGGTVTLTALDGYKGDLIAEGGSTLKISTGKLMVDNDIIVKGSAVLNNGSTHSGDITVNGDLLKGSTVKLIDKDQRVTLNDGIMSGTISGIGRVDVKGGVDITQGKLTAEQIFVNSGGSLTNTKAWALAKGQTLAFAGGSMQVGAKGLSTVAGSTLRLQQSGTLNGSLTLGGGELVYYGNSPLTVTGTLTLSKATTLTMSGDLVKGTTYTLFQCSDIVTPKSFDAATFFNNPDVVVNVTSTSITATYNGRTVHNATLSSVMLTEEPEDASEEALPELSLKRNAATIATASDTTAEELPEEEEPLVEAPHNGVVLVTDEPQQNMLAAVADAMVQADWGVVNAQRAFSGTLNGRHQSLRAIAGGRSAVWVNAFGSTTRQSSAHGHAGADHDLYGGVLGVEFNAGQHGAAGVAIGHSWNRVSPIGMNRVKQDTQHAGVFGRARLAASGTNSLWLEASAAYGKTDSRSDLGYSRERWSQNGCTLNVRANDAWQVGEETAMNAFAGLEYAATDNGNIEGVKTGSVQNLRGELGVGITRTIGRGMVFAEAALMGDMVRHNPQANLGIARGGANPGRIGGSISVGGAYIINEHWSVNATYTFEGVKHNNSHNINAGATFRF